MATALAATVAGDVVRAVLGLGSRCGEVVWGDAGSNGVGVDVINSTCGVSGVDVVGDAVGNVVGVDVVGGNAVATFAATTLDQLSGPWRRRWGVRGCWRRLCRGWRGGRCHRARGCCVSEAVRLSGATRDRVWCWGW